MDYDLLFIGGGPAGYEGAIAAAKKGMRTAVVEMDLPGGTCLQRGCIPTKAILHSVRAIKQINDFAKIGVRVEKFQVAIDEIRRRKERIVAKQTRGIELLFKRHGVTLIKGKALLTGHDTVLIDGQKKVSSRHVVVASGSRPAELPFLQRDGRRIVASDDLLGLDDVPDTLLVIGAGAVGLEWALIYNYLGSKVTVVEIMETVMPGMDPEIAQILRNELIKQNITIHTATTISEPRIDDAVSLQFRKGNQDWRQDFSKALLAVGRVASTAEAIAPDLPMRLDAKGFIAVSANLETTLPGVFACGDVIGAPLLAHKASHQAMAIVELIHDNRPIPHHPLPAAVFTFPEVATVGISESQARREGVPIKVGRFPYAAGSRANAIDEKSGLVKVITGVDNTVLGAHIVGAEAGELIPLLTYAVSRRLKSDDFKDLVFIHPTLGESVWEALGETGGFAIHI
ncbi:MAG: dihydrolipoyl dehydrogenase [Candidatus Aminicenantes bacterium]|nr:dihydrolipoyl dehydrogenase [Candidatus Aminicenantes bacterium]